MGQTQVWGGRLRWHERQHGRNLDAIHILLYCIYPLDTYNRKKRTHLERQLESSVAKAQDCHAGVQGLVPGSGWPIQLSDAVADGARALEGRRG